MREHPSNQRLPFCAVVARARRVIADARGSRARTASARSQLQINAGHVPALLHPRVSCSAHRDAARADTKRPGAEFAGTAVDNAAVHDAAPTASPAAELSNVDAPAGMLPESSQRKRRRSAEHIAWNKITKRTPLTLRTATTGDLLQRFGAMQRTRNHDRRQISRHPPRSMAVRERSIAARRRGVSEVPIKSLFDVICVSCASCFHAKMSPQKCSKTDWMVISCVISSELWWS